MKTSAVYVHIPAHKLEQNLDFLLTNRLQPEIACQEVALDDLDFTTLSRCAKQLAKEQLSTTLHAPFQGFQPGSSDPCIRTSSLRLAHKALELAEQIQATKIVFHPAIPMNSDHHQPWLQNNLTFWPELINQARAINCIICLENIYELTPALHLQLFKGLDSSYFAHVFDLGHWHAFSDYPLLNWLQETQAYLKHFHLHDNRGQKDEHLPLKAGTAPIDEFFRIVQSLSLDASFTIENISQKDLKISLNKVQDYLG